MPIITDPIYHYQAVNVEAQQRSPSSLLNWLKRLIAIRKKSPVFGRGTLEFVSATNQSVVAYLRQFAGETVLVVNNLSRFAQPADLDLSAFAGCVPVEMIGGQRFQRIGKEPYEVTLSPHAFFWFRLVSD
jgi:maltose alpha-D-glucosyltransferase/alpha-amylase